MRKLVRIGSNVRIPGDSRYRNKKYCSCFSKKIEMRKMTMPNFCINFLNKAEKSLPILYDFAVASLADAWIKMARKRKETGGKRLHPSRMRGSKHGARKTILYTLKKRKEEKNGWNYYQKGNITYIRQWK